MFQIKHGVYLSYLIINILKAKIAAIEQT